MSKVFLLKDDGIGERGELGKKLMLSFLGTLLTMDKQPKAMYLLNRAVLLATIDSEGVEALKHLEEKGVLQNLQHVLNLISRIPQPWFPE